MKTKNVILLCAGTLSFCAAVFQLVISCIPKWSAFFGAGDALVSNPTLLLAAGLGVTILLVVWGFYGLSGAGLIRKLPLLRLVIFLIGAIYIFRGLPIIFLLLAQVKVPSPVKAIEIQNLLVTLGALIAGIFYWGGVIIGWKHLSLKESFT
jgi:hypothetical protein